MLRTEVKLEDICNTENLYNISIQNMYDLDSPLNYIWFAKGQIK